MGGKKEAREKGLHRTGFFVTLLGKENVWYRNIEEGNVVQRTPLPKQILAGGLLCALVLASIACLFPLLEKIQSPHTPCWVLEFMLFSLLFVFLTHLTALSEHRIPRQVMLLQLYKPPK
ncbi:MAG: hypothetical protein D6736_03685 [Nitrospinota bacterium]|nr:MAG: hypothetical protein D6736_03685 [Nitrospinota bacterium]